MSSMPREGGGKIPGFPGLHRGAGRRRSAADQLRQWIVSLPGSANRCRRMRVGLTYDLRSEYLAAGYSDVDTAEFDQPETIDAIAGALSRPWPVRRAHWQRPTAHSAPCRQRSRWDLVFNFCEGLHGFGRESLVPALLDAWQIPYVFSDPARLCRDAAQGHREARGQGSRTGNTGLCGRRIDRASLADLSLRLPALREAGGGRYRARAYRPHRGPGHRKSWRRSARPSWSGTGSPS